MRSLEKLGNESIWAVDLDATVVAPVVPICVVDRLKSRHEVPRRACDAEEPEAVVHAVCGLFVVVGV